MTLEAFINAPRTVTVGDREFAIRDITMRDYPRFLTAAQKLMGSLAGGDMIAAITQNYGDAREALSICTGASHDDIDALTPDQFIELAGAVADANMTFFVEKVTPALTRTTAQVIGRMRTLGQPSSPG